MIPMPKKYTEEINKRALEYAQQRAPKKTGKGAQNMTSDPQEGQINIVFPRPYDYMYYQEVGTKSRVMWELAGKTIPIQLPDGTTIFRKATAQNIGRRRITSRNEKGQIVTSKLSWWHPGIKPKRFASAGMQQAWQEFSASIDSNKAYEIIKESQVGPIFKSMGI